MKRFDVAPSVTKHRVAAPPGAIGGLLIRLVAATCALGSVACRDTASPPPSAGSVTVSPPAQLVDAIGATAQFIALVRAENGEILSNAFVVWRSSDVDVATIGAGSGLATSVGVGVTEIKATSGSAFGTANLEVYLDPNAPPYVPGAVYVGRNEYVEYLAGDLPLILSAPHGGTAEPDEITNRTTGVTTRDRETEELVRALTAAIRQRTGRVPHVVISRLHRMKLDPNREVEEAAQGNPFAERAWKDYHEFIDDAKLAVIDAFGTGLYVDIHAHGHDIQRIELGYLLQSADLALSDQQLSSQENIAKSSIRGLVQLADTGFAGLIRGPSSLGGLLADRGFPTVPSPDQPSPGLEPYFTGGYSTQRHGSRDGGLISAIQIEAHFTGARDTEANRTALATALAEALESYLMMHFGLVW